jgi:hypothetical protein
MRRRGSSDASLAAAATAAAAAATATAAGAAAAPPALRLSRLSVAVRLRPSLPVDDDGGAPAAAAAAAVAVGADGRSVSVQRGAGLPPQRFAFDAALGPGASQADAHRRSAAAQAVADVLAGANAVVLVYGQTGGGKTHTVFGPHAAQAHAHAQSQARQPPPQQQQQLDLEAAGAHDAAQLGLLPRALHDLFERCAVRADAGAAAAAAAAAAAGGEAGAGAGLSALAATAAAAAAGPAAAAPAPPPTAAAAFSISVRYLQLYNDSWVDLLAPATASGGPGPGGSLGAAADPHLTPGGASTHACADVRAALRLQWFF